MKQTMIEQRIGGYKFVFDCKLIDSGFMYSGFHRQDWFMKAYIGGIPYPYGTAQGYSFLDTQKELVDYISWTFKR